MDEVAFQWGLDECVGYIFGKERERGRNDDILSEGQCFQQKQRSRNTHMFRGL